MIRNVSATLTCAALALALAGCTGGEAVEDQERFQLDRSPAEAAANEFRYIIDALNTALSTEGMASMKNELQSVMEDLENIDTEALEGDNKANAEQLKAKIRELAEKVNGGASESEVKEMLQELSDLAAKMPGGDGGGAAEEA
ncbi:hypothetical protein Mal4_00790 [Maioricimonas rarisocia]|uniref:Uncharacterized protein n=1 Tax=Maioricimonas rarisocia TaxID=2528026 RepID=A0A517YZZ2_9PLAN|nr:hypothetical protein [Maioricimonas rarisocia]QDU35797.1 hypothetical protein Mal4_00790 [Maioricimonas rarisocia]